MITSSIKSHSSTYTVTLDVGGAPQVEAGDGWRVEKFDVIGVRISYADSEVTALAILTTTDDLATRLEDPTQWEPWLPALVDEHRPAAR